MSETHHPKDDACSSQSINVPADEVIDYSITATHCEIKDLKMARIEGRPYMERVESPYYKGKRWAVRMRGLVLAKDNQWYYEPELSRRTAEFYERCRFNYFTDALLAYDRQLAHDSKAATPFGEYDPKKSTIDTNTGPINTNTVRTYERTND